MSIGTDQDSMIFSQAFNGASTSTWVVMFKPQAQSNAPLRVVGPLFCPGRDRNRPGEGGTLASSPFYYSPSVSSAVDKGSV